MNFAVLRIAKLKSMGEVAGSLAHITRSSMAKRSRQPQIDPTRTARNHGVGTLADVSAAIPEKRRSNAVLAYEVVLSASPDFFANESKEKKDAWYHRSLDWLRETFGQANVKARYVHNDETTPHVHAVVVPLKDGKLNAYHFTGSREKLRKMQTSYAEKFKDLGIKRGLERVGGRHIEPKEFRADPLLALQKKLRAAKQEALKEKRENEGLRQKIEALQKQIERLTPAPKLTPGFQGPRR